MPPNASQTDRRDWRGITRRFGYYFVGIAVGFAMLGLMRQFRPPRQAPGNRPVQAAPNPLAETNGQAPARDAVGDAPAGEMDD